MKLRIMLDGELHAYNPKPDITAYECALINKFLIIATSGVSRVPEDEYTVFIHSANLTRHFDKEQ